MLTRVLICAFVLLPLAACQHPTSRDSKLDPERKEWRDRVARRNKRRAATRSAERERAKRIRVVEVISDPPGARIMVNGDYVGDAPVEFELKFRDPFKRLANPWEPQSLHVEAYPKQGMMQAGAASGSVQSRSLILDRPDDAPKRIFFDMLMRRTPDAPLVNIATGAGGALSAERRFTDEEVAAIARSAIEAPVERSHLFAESLPDGAADALDWPLQQEAETRWVGDTLEARARSPRLGQGWSEWHPVSTKVRLSPEGEVIPQVTHPSDWRWLHLAAGVGEYLKRVLGGPTKKV